MAHKFLLPFQTLFYTYILLYDCTCGQEHVSYIVHASSAHIAAVDVDVVVVVVLLQLILLLIFLLIVVVVVVIVVVVVG